MPRSAPIAITNVEREEVLTRIRTNAGTVYDHEKVLALLQIGRFRVTVLNHYYRAYNSPETVIEQLVPQLIKLLEWVPNLTAEELAGDLEGMPPSIVTNELGLGKPDELGPDLMAYWLEVYPAELPEDSSGTASTRSRSGESSILSQQD